MLFNPRFVSNPFIAGRCSSEPRITVLAPNPIWLGPRQSATDHPTAHYLRFWPKLAMIQLLPLV